MSRIYVETRSLPQLTMSAQARDIIRHYYLRRTAGKAVVVASQPFLLLRIARKHWLELLRTVQRERSKTLDPMRIAELSQELTQLQKLRFSVKSPQDAPSAALCFITPRQAHKLPDTYRTVYADHTLGDTAQEGVASIVPDGGLLVIYQASHKQ